MEFQFTENNIPIGKSFIVQKQPYEEYSVLHAHKNYELNLMTSVNGKRIVGNNISPFEDDDLILIGPGLPHNRELSGPEGFNPPECLILIISEKLIKSDLIQIPELESIRDLFTRALSGVAFKGKGLKAIKQLMEQLSDLHGVDSFIVLTNLLKILTKIEDQKTISLTPELASSHFKDMDHIKTVYDYVAGNLNESITLDTAASLLNMAPGSFCRFFKKRTGKSFIQYVKEIRISQASKLLSDTEIPISQICLESGYNNLANFNFYFKSIMKMTPSEYRKNFR